MVNVWLTFGSLFVSGVLSATLLVAKIQIKKMVEQMTARPSLNPALQDERRGVDVAHILFI